MRTVKFYKILAMVLLILNIGTITFFFLTAPPHPPRPGQEKISDKIGLTGEAKKEVDRLEKKHHQDKRKMMKRDLDLHNKLYHALDNEEQAAEIMSEIHSNKEAIEEMTYEFFSEVSSHCNKSQKKELENFIHKGLRMITHHPGRPKR